MKRAKNNSKKTRKSKHNKTQQNNTTQESSCFQVRTQWAKHKAEDTSVPHKLRPDQVERMTEDDGVGIAELSNSDRQAFGFCFCIEKTARITNAKLFLSGSGSLKDSRWFC